MAHCRYFLLEIFDGDPQYSPDPGGVSPFDSHIVCPQLSVCHACVGTALADHTAALLSSPIPDSSAVAGRDLHHNIKTAYYEAQIPVWIDAVETPSDWSFMWKEMEGAKEVVEAVGAWIAVFEKPTSKSDLVGLISSAHRL